jgi:hypothetical protein
MVERVRETAYPELDLDNDRIVFSLETQDVEPSELGKAAAIYAEAIAEGYGLSAADAKLIVADVVGVSEAWQEIARHCECYDFAPPRVGVPA